MIYKVERLIRSRYNNVRLYVKICPDLLFQGVGSLLLYYSRKPKVVGSKARLSVWICSIITFHWNKKFKSKLIKRITSSLRIFRLLMPVVVHFSYARRYCPPTMMHSKLLVVEKGQLLCWFGWWRQIDAYRHNKMVN